MIIAERRIALEDALRVKSAELWLKLGDPMHAMRELERLSPPARRHPWAVDVFLLALAALRGPEFFQLLTEGAGVPAEFERFLESEPVLA